jgi:DNA replication protein DnaC
VLVIEKILKIKEFMEMTTKEAIMDTLRGIETISEEQSEQEEARKMAVKHEQYVNDSISKMPARYRDFCFEDYVFYGTDEQMKRQQKLIEYLKDGKSLVMYGNNGTGKTMLAFSSMKNQLSLDKTVKYITFMEIMDEVHQYFGTDKAIGELVSFYSGFDYLVIDEIDKSYGSKSELINLFRIVNNRYNEETPTVLITNAGQVDATDSDGNMRLGVINSIGRSSYERIVEDGTAIYMDWESYRKTHRNVK